MARLPFLRLTIFLSIGIFLGIMYPNIQLPLWSILPPLGATLIFSFRLGERQYQRRWMFGASLLILLSIVGILRTRQTTPIIWDRETDGKGYLLAEIEDLPQERRATYCVNARLYGREVPSGTKARLYIAKDSLSQDSLLQGLSIGEIILLPNRLVKPIDNPNDFDRYLFSIGYSGTIYLPKNQWKRMDGTPQTTLVGQAMRARQKVERQFEEAGITGDELAIISALTLGDKSQLTPEIKASYSATGASHVLAVSGLHVGIVYLIIFTLLAHLLPGEAMKRVRIPVTLAFLWGYAFITGLSPSVVRASIMLTLVAFGDAIGRKSTTANTVLASAFCMLLYQPRYLTDIGFQLSYAAVFSIILWQDKIYKTFVFKPLLWDKIWSLTSVSIAAQIGTLPIVLFHFHHFSNTFWISGLIVIPAATILLYGTLLLMLCTPFPPLARWIGRAISSVTYGMNSGIEWLEKIPHSSVNGIIFHTADLLFLYALLAAMAAVMKLRSFRRIATMLSLLLLYTAYLTAMKLPI